MWLSLGENPPFGQGSRMDLDMRYMDIGYRRQDVIRKKHERTRTDLDAPGTWGKWRSGVFDVRGRKGKADVGSHKA